MSEAANRPFRPLRQGESILRRNESMERGGEAAEAHAKRIEQAVSWMAACKKRPGGYEKS